MTDNNAIYIFFIMESTCASPLALTSSGDFSQSSPSVAELGDADGFSSDTWRSIDNR